MPELSCANWERAFLKSRCRTMAFDNRHNKTKISSIIIYKIQKMNICLMDKILNCTFESLDKLLPRAVCLMRQFYFVICVWRALFSSSSCLSVCHFPANEEFFTLGQIRNAWLWCLNKIFKNSVSRFVFSHQQYRKKI